MTDHDGTYHLLFSHPGMVAQLLRDFVAEPWLEELDLEAMERVNTKFYAETGERREGDVVWRIPMRDGRDVFVLLLLEFQSRADRFMAVRIMAYVALLWQQLIREGRIAAGNLLPPVWPVVIYNGNARWTRPLSVRELIALPGDSPLWPWQPEMRYDLIDEGAYSEAELAGRDTLAALLFRLEQTREPDRVVLVVDEIIGWFRQHPAFEGLASIFAGLVEQLIAAEGIEVPRFETLLEARNMLATRAAEWKRQWRQEGRQEGERTILLRQLERRFGRLPDWAAERVTAAEPSLLEEWSLRLLDARSLDEVFSDPAS